MKIETEVELINEIINARRSSLGADYVPYRNHCYRVYNFCRALSAPLAIDTEKLGIAAAFHDLGIWTADTLDYLAPSKRLARDFLVQSGRPAMIAEIEAMIDNHHKLTGYRENPAWLVESFRQADWLDISRGILHFNLPRSLISKVLAAFPNNGFHKRLVQLTIQRIKTHPLDPLPMFKR